MRLTTISAFCLAGIMSAGFVASGFAQSMMSATALEPDPAIAGMSSEELVAARRAAMKEDGGLIRRMAGLTGQEAIDAATIFLRNFTNFPALFREGSITDQSEALPVIWERWDEFNGLLLEGQALSGAALAAASAGDTAGYQAAVKGLGPLCGTCHQQFRAGE
jgi:cytochrome c556